MNLRAPNRAVLRCRMRSAVARRRAMMRSIGRWIAFHREGTGPQDDWNTEPEDFFRSPVSKESEAYGR